MDDFVSHLDWFFILDLSSRLVLAALLGTLLAFSRAPDRYRLNLIQAHALLAIAGALFMVIIAGNAIIAIGLLGAASVVRYRYAVRNPRDASTIILALGMGMACGSNRPGLAVAATFIILVMLRLLSSLLKVIPQSVMRWREEMVLSIQTTDEDSLMKQIYTIFERNDVHHSLISFDRKHRTEPDEIVTQITFEVKLDSKTGVDHLTNEIFNSNIQRVSWHRSK